MSEEIPESIEPLSAEELVSVAKLTVADRQIIDAAILANVSLQWLKVARIVTTTTDALVQRYPDLSCVFYTRRLSSLVEQGRLEAKGNLTYIRFSEVRIPTPTITEK